MADWDTIIMLNTRTAHAPQAQSNERDRVIEECARVAEDDPDYPQEGEWIAKRIRALAKEAPREGFYSGAVRSHHRPHFSSAVHMQKFGRILPMPTERKGFWKRVMGRAAAPLSNPTATPA